MEAAQYAPGQVLPGTVYRVVRHIATGGMGSVYDVEDTTVEKRYVLKTLHPQLVSREDLARRMRDEAKSLAKLQHPNIVDVITAGVTSDASRLPFYVMERLIGQNLRVVLEKQGSLDPVHAYRIAIDVADALEHAHENNIVHRDVKPENIFLHRNANGTTTTKLLDFGIVRLLDRKASHTRGKFIGTLRYASPEQISGGEIGPATDIYSLGVVLFEMLAGRGPFDDAGDAYAIGAAHAKQPAPPLTRFVAVGKEVERLVASTLAKEPSGRPRDCFAFASELRRLLRVEEATPRSVTAVNVVSVVAPSTAVAGTTEGGSLATAPTARAAPAVGDSLPPTRNERPEAVSPVAPTLAAPDRGSPLPAPAVPGGRIVDRDAPTRASAPNGATQRLAQNDTRMELRETREEDAIRAAFGEPAPLVVPTPAGSRAPSGIVFPPMRAPAGTGPLAGEARTRAPERGPLVLVGVASVVAVVLVGGAFLAVRRPWRSAGGATPALTAPPVPIAAAPEGSASVTVAVVPSVAPVPVPAQSSGAGGRATGELRVAAPATGSAPSRAAGGRPGLAPARPKPAASGYSPAVGFE